MKYKVYKSGVIDGDNWAVITKVENNKHYHYVLNGNKFLEEGAFIELPVEKWIIWEESGEQISPTIIKNTKYIYKGDNFTKGFFNNSILNFGIYHGFEVGIVYAFDLGYIEWCILNLEDFFIVDIEELQAFGTLRKKTKNYRERTFRFIGYSILMKQYKTIQKLSEEIPFLNINNKLSEEAIKMNNIKRDKYYQLFVL